MRIVVAPDKFKSCLSAQAVAAAIAQGLLCADASIELDLCPMADGGEGTVDALVAATAGSLLSRTVTGPLPPTKLNAAFGLLGDRQTAVIEMAAASGLALLASALRNPMNTTTYGTGELLLAAAETGAAQIILGIGGSATTDAGLGCIQACGWTVRLDDGTVRGPADAPVLGRDVAHVIAVEPSPAASPLLSRLQRITVACDVTNPLFGPNGAARIFGPQKGASPAQVDHLDSALRQLATRLGRLDLAAVPGTGAAGGLGFALIAFLNAHLRSGIDIVIDAVNLRHRLRNADLCITGEGRFDTQSLAGKTPIGVARVCKELGVPCMLIAGALDPQARLASKSLLCAHYAISEITRPHEDPFTDAALLLSRAAAHIVQP